MVDLAQLLLQQQSPQLNRQADIANLLLQSGQRTTNPLVAALSGFIGTRELSNIADKQAQIDKENQDKINTLLASGIDPFNSEPSNVQEWKYFQTLTPKQQEQYLNMKRATQTLNLGGTQAVLNPIGGIKEQYTVTPKIVETPQYQQQVSEAKTTGENKAQNAEVANSSRDIIGLYDKLKEDAKAAPSGLAESAAARISNALNMPTDAAVAQGQFDADLNNLYLATIRSLKGTGRVMEQELVKISEAAPKSEDSMAVKISKAKAHMDYYKKRMRGLGFDPDTGQPLGGMNSLQGGEVPLLNGDTQPINNTPPITNWIIKDGKLVKQ